MTTHSEKNISYTQGVLDLITSRPPTVQAEIDRLAKSEVEERGAVFTRREVVEFMLDLVNYTLEEDLTQTSLLEPSCGAGDFLLIALHRLLDSYFLHGGTPQEIVLRLKNCIRSVEIHHQTFLSTKHSITHQLMQRGISKLDAISLADAWLVQDDFLLTEISQDFTHIIGNPPYIRQELIPDILLLQYRKRYHTMYDRADLYVPFIERSLSLLSPYGKLAFICSDRWIKNKYGGPLRDLVSKHFHLQYYIDMTGTDAFNSSVSAYPAIIVLSSQKDNATLFVHQPLIRSDLLSTLAKSMQNYEPYKENAIQMLTDVAEGSEPWLLNASSSELTLLHRLECAFSPLEDVGCKVGIGVATGCDSVFIGTEDQLPIEEDCKLPILMAADIQTGNIRWSGNSIINPFKENGELISLNEYPKLKAYFMSKEQQVRKRNVAKKNPKNWYRTIDRIYPSLTHQPKLLIPDIKGTPHVVYDEGKYYPHHNLYVVTSSQWDLRALQTILRSSVTRFFVTSYSIRIRGGYLRFQAQYLRRIRIPLWNNVPFNLREALVTAATSQNIDVCNEAAFDLYQLNSVERKLLLQSYR